MGYFIASAIMVGVVRGQIGANFWTLHSFQFGATLDMLIFMRIAVLRTAARHRDAQRAAQERDTLHSLAHSDPLTGLLNRRGLDDALRRRAWRALRPSASSRSTCSTSTASSRSTTSSATTWATSCCGSIAQRLRASVRAGDGVARVGGDEFVVMADGLTNDAQAQDLGQKLLEAFRAPFRFGQHTCSVSATIGYALAPADAADASALLKAADAAMYTGKQEGKDRLLRLA